MDLFHYLNNGYKTIFKLVNIKDLFGLVLYVPVNSYGLFETVTSPNQTFFRGKLDYAVNQYFVHILWLN